MDEKNRGWYWLVLLLAAAVTLLYAERRDLYGRYLAHVRSVQEFREADHQRSELEHDIEASGLRIQYLGTDPVEIEAAVRRNKNLVREGETVFRIEKAPGTGR